MESAPEEPPKGTVEEPAKGTVTESSKGTVTEQPKVTVVEPPKVTVVEPPKATVVGGPTAPPPKPAPAAGEPTAPAPPLSPHSSKIRPDFKCTVLDTDMTEELQKEIIDVAKDAWAQFPIKNFVYKPDEEDAIAPELGASFEVSTQTAKEQTANHLAHMAQYIKTETDKKYRPCWHVIVGNDFGCYMTHDSGTFIYFDMGEYRPHVLMFKSGTLDQPLY